MKVCLQTNDKPKYDPITITLGTAEEYFQLLGLMGECTKSMVEDGLDYYGLKDKVSVEEPINNQLCSALAVYRAQVKETL